MYLFKFKRAILQQNIKFFTNLGRSRTKILFRVFWDVAPCSHIEVGRRFGSAHRHHHQDRLDDRGRKRLWNVGPLPKWLHGATSYKTLNSIFAAMRTWNLTTNMLYAYIITCFVWHLIHIRAVCGLNGVPYILKFLHKQNNQTELSIL
jgi:hypothetical protein